MESPVYSVKYDGVMGIMAKDIVIAADELIKTVTKKDRKGLGQCRELMELKCAMEAFIREEQRRVQNSVKFVTKLRILKERRITASIDNEKRPWLLCSGDVATIVDFGYNCYVAQSEDVAKARYRLMFNKDGEDYESFQTPAD